MIFFVELRIVYFENNYISYQYFVSEIMVFRSMNKITFNIVKIKILSEIYH